VKQVAFLSHLDQEQNLTSITKFNQVKLVQICEILIISFISILKSKVESKNA